MEGSSCWGKSLSEAFSGCYKLELHCEFQWMTLAYGRSPLELKCLCSGASVLVHTVHCASILHGTQTCAKSLCHISTQKDVHGQGLSTKRLLTGHCSLTPEQQNTPLLFMNAVHVNSDIPRQEWKCECFPASTSIMPYIVWDKPVTDNTVHTQCMARATLCNKLLPALLRFLVMGSTG